MLVLVIEVFVSTAPLFVAAVWFELSTVCFNVVYGTDFVDGNDDAVDWSVDGVVKSLFSNFPVDETNDVVEGDRVVVESSSQLFCWHRIEIPTIGAEKCETKRDYFFFSSDGVDECSLGDKFSKLRQFQLQNELYLVSFRTWCNVCGLSGTGISLKMSKNRSWTFRDGKETWSSYEHLTTAQKSLRDGKERRGIDELNFIVTGEKLNIQ